MRQFDVIVIGGGVLGCIMARNLRRWQKSTAILEQESDVCQGITRANSGICYPGYDNKPGSLKAELTVRGNANMAALCDELEVPYSQCGSLLVTYDPGAVGKLERKLRNGMLNGVEGVRLLTGPEAEAMEPMLRPGVAAALYAPTTGTVNPWQLGIAACENALKNGAVLYTGTQVTSIAQDACGYVVHTPNDEFQCRVVINCGGLFADRIHDTCFPHRVGLKIDGAEYLVLDKLARKPGRVIFHQADRCGKGITAIPCPEGNLLLSGARKDTPMAFASSREGLEALRQDARSLLPQLDTSLVIRSFGAARPNPQLENGENISDYCIENPAPGFFSLIGIKTPGLTCANELGMLVARRAAEYLHAPENPEFDPKRRAITERDNEIICQCEGITRGEIIAAIRRGASTVDGVKRRVGTGMGRCQGSRCTYEIEKLLEDHQNGTL